MPFFIYMRTLIAGKPRRVTGSIHLDLFDIYKTQFFGSRNYILPQDLVGFLPADKIDNAFEMLDVDGDGKVSLQDIRDAVLQLYKV